MTVNALRIGLQIVLSVRALPATPMAGEIKSTHAHDFNAMRKSVVTQLGDQLYSDTHTLNSR